MGERPGGVALISVFLLLSVLLLLVVTLVSLVHTDSFQSKSQLDDVAALYAAEEGVAHAIDRLRLDPGWAEGFQDEPTSGGRGSYSVVFNTGGTVLGQESVNNLGGEGAADGPLGAATVPEHSLFLVVEGKAGNATRQLEIVIKRGSANPLGVPILASGKIEFHGETRVDGLESLEGNAVAAGAHSNYADGPADQPIITWEQGSGGERLFIDGLLTTKDSRPVDDVIDLGPVSSSYDVAGLESDAGTKTPPSSDVSTLVDGKAGAQAPVFTAGVSTLASGTYHTSGNVDLSGDLVLENGVELYIDGDLSVNGTIKGQGTVYVDGAVHFKGDSDIDAGQRVAVMAEGDIHLEGFDGEKYLRDIGAGPMLDDTYYITSNMFQVLENPQGDAFGQHQTIDDLNHHLGAPIDHPPHEEILYDPNISFGLFEQMQRLVNDQPDSSKKSFLVDKLQNLRDLSASAINGQINNYLTDQQKLDIIDAFLEDPTMSHPFLIESLGDMGGTLPQAKRDKAVTILKNLVGQLNYDGIGNSYFHGLLYSNGSIQATNQVKILGGVVANGPAGSGKVVFSGGSQVTFMETFAQETTGAKSVLGEYHLATWFSR